MSTHERWWDTGVAEYNLFYLLVFPILLYIETLFILNEVKSYLVARYGKSYSSSCAQSIDDIDMCWLDLPLASKANTAVDKEMA